MSTKQLYPKNNARVGVLISGRGSNLQALHRACQGGSLDAEIVRVISNKPHAAGLDWASSQGIPVALFNHKEFDTRRAHEQKIVDLLRRDDVEWICLAGYMRLLSAYLIRAFPMRIVNIHPSLLPAFPGLEAQRQALEHGVRFSGCTVHLVDENLDSGPIIMQSVVRVELDDTEESLSERILVQEHQTYWRALQLLISGGVSTQGRVLLPDREIYEDITKSL